MASGGSVYSQTLHDITNTKLDELAKKRATFESQRRQIIVTAESDEDTTEKLSIIAKDVKGCFSLSTSGGRVVRDGFSNIRLATDMRNLDRFLAQAQYDTSITPRMLGQWKQIMLRHLELQSLKFDYGSLYGQMTTDWLKTKQIDASALGGEDADVDDFENISGGKKLDYRVNWEHSVFEQKEVDTVAIAKLLHELFESTPEDSRYLVKALADLRMKVENFEHELQSSENFDAASLRWTIKGLLTSDLLSDEKRDALRDFMGNETVISEIADVLNMRMAALETWSWGNEVLLEERRQLNGSFKIQMHEDLLQAIFLQYIGVRWSVFWKRTLSQFRGSSGVWKSSRTSIPALDRKRREYYLGAANDEYRNVSSKKNHIYRKSYFVSQLLDSEQQERTDEEGDEEADFEAFSAQAAPTARAKQTARRSTGKTTSHKRVASVATPMAPMAFSSAGAAKVFTEEESEDAAFGDDDSDKARNTMEAKQKLLHLLSADSIIQSRLHGELTCFRSQIDNLYPSLSHSAIDSVLTFFGVSQTWRHFFKRFLKAPLRFADDESSEPRQRQNGCPGSHVLSEVFGEVVLFCLDFQINQQTGGEHLWRIQDDFWLWSSSHATCVKAWIIVERFIKTMSLQLNEPRTGALRMARDYQKPYAVVPLETGDTLPRGQIRWGMLYLNPESGRFEIDQGMVDKHIDELTRQLKGKQNCTFEWIQAWNSYVATFFTSNFGKAANCFGRQHVDNMLATHKRIQRRIFSSSTNAYGSASERNGGSVIEFLRHTIEQRYGISDIPDGYFYLPTELGGLEVRNPFIGLLQIHETVHEKPNLLLDEFEEAEKEAYIAARARFESGDVQHWRYLTKDPEFKPVDADQFLSFDEYIKYREEMSSEFTHGLLEVYTTLLAKPGEEAIETDNNGTVKTALNSLGLRPNLRGILADWYSMEPYWKWVAQLYGPEMIDKFGGFGIVDPGMLPMGMVSMFRSGRVNWQEE